MPVEVQNPTDCREGAGVCMLINLFAITMHTLLIMKYDGLSDAKWGAVGGSERGALPIPTVDEAGYGIV
jgi:hypothetical protein